MTTTTGTDARRVAAERMAEAAGAYLEGLGADQRVIAQRPFEDPLREEWYYTPTWQAGLPLSLMSSPQQATALRLAASGLSFGGFVTATTIMNLENVLDAQGGFRPSSYNGATGPSRGRDPQMYFAAVFGEPGGETWGWRFGGHHVSLNVTIRDGAVLSPTPTFFGSNPGEAPATGMSSLRPLAREEDLARELMHAFDAGQRATALLSAQAPVDIVQSNRSKVEDGALPKPIWKLFSATLADNLTRGLMSMTERAEAETTSSDHEAFRYHANTPRGIAAAAMSTAQREIFEALLRQYTSRLPDELADVEWRGLAERGIERLHFAWAGGLEKRKGHYYRIQGPRLLIEFDNVQNDANHIHTVWRDPEGDFGRDILAGHYAEAH